MLILFACIVSLAQINEVDNWLRGEEEERVDDFDLLIHVSDGQIYEGV